MDDWYVALVASFLKEVLVSIKSGTDEWRKTLDIFGQRRNRYLASIKDDHGCVKILGMREPKFLEAIYISVRISSAMHTRRYGDAKREFVDSAGVFLDSRQRQSRAEDDSISAIKLLKNKRHIVILGPP